ncbi:THO complex subunit 7, partial [Clonorchis sinensis]
MIGNCRVVSKTPQARLLMSHQDQPKHTAEQYSCHAAPIVRSAVTPFAYLLQHKRNVTRSSLCHAQWDRFRMVTVFRIHTPIILDEIIKRKLLIEGESGNDDRRLTLLLKNYLRWVASVRECDGTSDIGPFNEQETTRALFRVVQGNRFVCNSNLMMFSEYEIEKAKLRIEECREELRLAKIIRKNRREYDGLAKIIAEHPERDVTLAKYNKLENRLKRLREINEEYDRKIDLRKKQFHLFLSALHDLREMIE